MMVTSRDPTFGPHAMVQGIAWPGQALPVCRANEGLCVFGPSIFAHRKRVLKNSQIWSSARPWSAELQLGEIPAVRKGSFGRSWGSALLLCGKFVFGVGNLL